MTEPLPCPFCGHVGLSHNEGSTFRWLMTECSGCGAQCGEERINTMSMERSAAIEQAKEAAIVTWNTRAPQRKPLTEKEINVLWFKSKSNISWQDFETITYEIEAAHGIGETT